MALKNYTVFKLSFKTPLHINTGQRDSFEDSYEFISADTLKSAMVAAAFKTGFSPVTNNPETFINGFTISSAFPFLREHYFLPKPMIPLLLNFPAKDKDKQAKLFKKLQYIECDLFSKIIRAEESEINPKNLSDSGKFCFAQPGEYAKIMKNIDQERVNLERNSENTNGNAEPYLVRRTYFHEEGGLYFMMEDKPGFQKEDLIKCLNILKDSGIGTDKNAGNGFFTWKKEDLEISLPDDGNSYMNLSPYLPKEEELNSFDKKNTFFQLIKRGGYVAGASDENKISLRKNNIYMFSEGSVFVANKKPEGKLVNLKPEAIEHPVWREGRAFFLPVKILENEQN